MHVLRLGSGPDWPRPRAIRVAGKHNYMTREFEISGACGCTGVFFGQTELSSREHHWKLKLTKCFSSLTDTPWRSFSFLSKPFAQTSNWTCYLKLLWFICRLHWNDKKSDGIAVAWLYLSLSVWLCTFVSISEPSQLPRIFLLKVSSDRKEKNYIFQRCILLTETIMVMFNPQGKKDESRLANGKSPWMCLHPDRWQEAIQDKYSE